MSSTDKLLKKLEKNPAPKDFKWSELKSLLLALGYSEKKKGKTGGSRVKFVNGKTKDIINLHRPHPKPVLKEYQIKQILEKLKNQGLL